MTPELRIQLLGGFGLTYGDTRVSAVNSPRLRTLLAYLILHRAAPQPRQHLAFLLWPDSVEEQARTNLRNLVHLLRHALPHGECCLHSEGQALYWAPHVPYTLDVVEFEAAIRAGALQTAVELYHGDLLPDCYGDWIVSERERLRQLYIGALERLTQQLEEARAYQAALGYAQRLAREDPLCEAHCRRLIRLQMLAGDRAAALRTYHACATALRRELGVEPAPATQQLHVQLLHGIEARPADALSLRASGPGLPLVGRQGEWMQLLASWQSAASGRAQLVLITGDVGIGKTRLAEELLAWVGCQGCPTAQAICYAAEGSLPYGPIVAWLRSRPAPRLEDAWLVEIARLLPGVLAGRRDLGAMRPPDAPWQRQRLFEALARAVLAWGDPAHKAPGRGQADKTRCAAPAPILLVIDDLQWCDRDTLDWLHFLLRFAPRNPLLVVGTVRAGDLAADQPLAPLLDSLRRHGLVTEIELAPLSSMETLTLASQAAGRPLEPALTEPLYRGSEGNPLFVVEMIRAGLGRPGSWSPEHGEAALRAGQPLPPKIQQLLQARLEQLSPEAQQVAELAAVIGRDFHHAVLARAFEGDETSLVRALDELWRRRILRETSGDGYDFTHDKLRQVCYAGLSAARRRLAHRRVAEALAAVGAGQRSF